MIEEIDKLKRDNLKAWKLVEELEKENTALTNANKNNFLLVEKLKEEYQDKLEFFNKNKEKFKKIENDYKFLKKIIVGDVISKADSDKLALIFKEDEKISDLKKQIKNNKKFKDNAAHMAILDDVLKKRNEVIKQKNQIIENQIKVINSQKTPVSKCVEHIRQIANLTLSVKRWKDNFHKEQKECSFMRHLILDKNFLDWETLKQLLEKNRNDNALNQ